MLLPGTAEAFVKALKWRWGLVFITAWWLKVGKEAADEG